MAALFLLRHGPTEWTAARRLQGRSDIALSAAGRALVEGWRLPDRCRHCRWMTSPLRRCRETAELLRPRYAAAGDLRIEPRLAEMSFGEWEGYGLAELRAIHGPAMAEWEGRGLDFRAPGGESPRDVQLRLRPWLADVSVGAQDVVALTHKGVIRALFSLASGWDMREKPPDRLADYALHEFALDGAELRVAELNIPLQPGPSSAEAFP